MRSSVLLVIPALLACQGETEQRAAPVTPQPIGYPDIEANELHGAGCAYASGASMAPVVLTLGSEAVMKIDGKIHRFVLDPESEGAEQTGHRRYLARGRTLHLAVEGEGRQAGPGTTNYSGSVRLLDSAGAVLFETTGSVQCDA